MKSSAEIIKSFKKDMLPFINIPTFSNAPGIYAIFFTGEKFPIDLYSPLADEIIYIGKTESSSKSRDLKTHFASGKTGSSTLRRTLGALLREELLLKPVPRSEKEPTNKKYLNYKFDEVGEEKLTQWMTGNLGLAFYEIHEGVDLIKKVESSLINEVVPLLNLAGNPGNKFHQYISSKRKACVNLAQNNHTPVEAVPEVKKIGREKNTSAFRSGPGSNLYTGFWSKYLPVIKLHLKQAKPLSLQLSQNELSALGNRQSYAFRLELVDGRVANNIGGSAVARDLNRALNSDADIKMLLKGKLLVFRLTKGFELLMQHS